MAEQPPTQSTFCNLLFFQKKGLPSKLDQIHQQIDWSRLSDILRPLHGSRMGRKAYPSVTMFRCLLLQSWYNLSDYELEESLDDRISFRRFAGFDITDKLPDHSTFSIFRKALSDSKLTEKLFEEVERQMDNKRLLIKKGTIVDASLVEASVSKPDQQEDKQAGKSEIDEDAEWVKKGKKSHFGYKIHVGVDEESGLIRKAKMTKAKVHDGHVLKEMVSGDEKKAYADKAYDSKENRHYLKEKGIGDGILLKGHIRYKLKEEDVRRNRELSRTRGGVERIFATLKRWYGYTKVRYRGLKRNTQQFFTLCIAYNMKKMGVLCP